MPKILCAGCKWEFENPVRFSNHKRHCTCHIDADIAQRFEQLKNREGNLNLIQVDSGGENVYEGQQGLLNTAGGVDDDTNMGVLVSLIVVLLLILVLSCHLDMIRMMFPTPQPQSCIHLADPIEKFTFQCAIRMNFHHFLPLSPIKNISMIPTNLVPMVILLTEAPKAHWGLQNLSVCHWHTALVPTHMGSTAYIQWANRHILLMSTTL